MCESGSLCGATRAHPEFNDKSTLKYLEDHQLASTLKRSKLPPKNSLVYTNFFSTTSKEEDSVSLAYANFFSPTLKKENSVFEVPKQ